MEFLWKGTVSAEFPSIRPKLSRNCTFPQNVHTRKLGEISIFLHSVMMHGLNITLPLHTNNFYWYLVVYRQPWSRFLLKTVWFALLLFHSSPFPKLFCKLKTIKNAPPYLTPLKDSITVTEKKDLDFFYLISKASKHNRPKLHKDYETEEQKPAPLPHSL